MCWPGAGTHANSQPMSFDAPARVVRDARDHGVEFHPICVDASRWDCTLEKARRGTGRRYRRGSASPGRTPSAR